MRSLKYTSHLTSRIPHKTVCAFSRLRYDRAPLNTIGTRTHSYMPDLYTCAIFLGCIVDWRLLVSAYRENFAFLFPMRWNIPKSQVVRCLHFCPCIQKPKIQTESQFIFRLAHKMCVGMYHRLLRLITLRSGGYLTCRSISSCFASLWGQQRFVRLSELSPLNHATVLLHQRDHCGSHFDALARCRRSSAEYVTAMSPLPTIVIVSLIPIYTA